MSEIVLPLMNLEFIQLYKSMREAQEAGDHLRAERLARLCDAQIEKYEQQINAALEELEDVK